MKYTYDDGHRLPEYKFLTLTLNTFAFTSPYPETLPLLPLAICNHRNIATDGFDDYNNLQVTDNIKDLLIFVYNKYVHMYHILLGFD